MTAAVEPTPSTERLSVVYVGCLGRSSRAAMMLRALRDLGQDVRAVNSEALDARGERLYFKDPVWRVRNRLGLPPDRVNANAAVQFVVEQGPLDVLWVSKSLALRPETLEAARDLHPGAVLVFHSEDDMHARHNQSRWFRSALPLYDVVFTTKSYNADAGELPALGARRVEVVDKCFDRDLHRPVRVPAAVRRELGSTVGFVGTFERERAETMLRLAETGVPVRVFGSGWEGWKDRHPQLRIEGRQVLGEDYVRTICSTDVNLGFLRRQNRDLQTDRSVEIPACGGFLLAERTDEHRRMFEEGVEAEFFADFGELLQKAHYYAGHDEQRRHIAAAGRARCVVGGYSFHDRLRGMLRTVRELRDARDARDDTGTGEGVA